MQKSQLTQENRTTLIISLGDPAGIGTEITLKALGSKSLNKNIKPLLVGCKNNIHEIYSKFLEEIAISFPNKLGYYSRGKSLTDLNSTISFPFAGFGYDHTIDLKFMFKNQKHGFIQGNFNEQLMLSETDTFLNDLKDFIEKMKSIENLNGWVCGLGHGINKNTPEKNVHLFIEKIRKEFS